MMSDEMDDFYKFDQPRKRYSPITASEAKKMTESALFIKTGKELKSIFDNIEKKASEGEYELSIDIGSLSNASIERLESLGYEIDRTIGVISWKKETAKLKASDCPVLATEQAPHIWIPCENKQEAKIIFD